MKNILHITNEISIKNFSISSLLLYIVNSDKINKLFNVKLFCSNNNQKFSGKIKVENIGWLDFFKLKNILLKNFSKIDIFHVHGLWSPIQFYSILICIIFFKPIVIHPHGMMLHEAISSHGFFKKILKKSLLFILNILIINKKNVIFVAITNQEIKKVRTNFKNIIIRLISNPIPFDKEIPFKNNTLNFKKRFVFFGRIHPHKNIKEIVKYFIESNLSKKGWSLDIYGIEDDNNYLEELRSLTVNHPYVKIRKPIFGKEKQKIMSESWVNLLLSRSEVLSFSLLEAGTFGLPTVISKNIETLKDDKITIKILANKKENIIKTFIRISNWSYFYRTSLQKKLSNFFKKYKKNESINFFQSLSSLYMKSFTYNDEPMDNYKKDVNLNFVFSTISHSLNIFLPSVIMILSYFFLEKFLVADIGFFSSLFIMLTSIFSGNTRMLTIRDRTLDLLYSTLIFRILYSIFILSIFFLFLFYKSNLDIKVLIFLLALLIVVLWCHEIVLLIYEINLDRIKQFFFIVFQFSFILSLSILFILKNYILINFLVGLFCLIIFTINLSNIKKINIIFSNTFFRRTALYYAYLSSISIIVNIFAWRFYIYYIFTKEIAATLFIVFAIASFPATLFNNVIAPSFFYYKIVIRNYFKKITIFLFILSIIYGLASYKYMALNDYSGSLDLLFYKTLKLSIIGSFIMIYAMYFRHKIFYDTNKKNEVFVTDIIYGITLIFTLPILNEIGGLEAISSAFLLSSVLAALLYNKNLLLNKICNLNKIPNVSFVKK
jgi:glycosyltransferase involved in cell wall biosynthesis